MMKFVLSFCMIVLCACGDSEDEYGFAIGDIVGKTLILTKDNGNVYLSVDHLTDSGLIVNTGTIDYGKYPPSYSYKTIGYNEASYHLEVTKVTYIPYYQINNYSKFSFNINLTFISDLKGTYRGTETNAEGKNKNISGTFTLN